MKTMHILYQLMRADFFERVRRYSFLVILCLAAFAAYAYLPARTATYLTLGLGNARGIYNSAWTGGATALLTSALLSLPGFYLVKNAIERDQRTGVGQIIATTPLKKFLYTLGKALSNFAVLAVLVGCIAVAAGVVQLIRGEDLHIDLLALVTPFLFVTLPTMALVAALAVLFETIAWLRSTGGNVIYFVLWMGSLLFTFAVSSQALNKGYTVSVTTDFLGIIALLASMTATARAAFPGYHSSFAIGGTGVQGPVQTFVWSGVQWTPQLVAGRLMWIAGAIGIALFAAVFFHRFDPVKEGRKRATLPPSSRLSELEEIALPATYVRLTPLVSQRRKFRFVAMLQAELRVMCKGTPWWWYLIAIGLIVAGWFAPLSVGSLLLAFAWIWPLRLWSAMGNREMYYQTNRFIFATLFPLRRQLPATWLAGVLVTVLLGSGVVGHLILAGSWANVLAWAVAAVFIPTLALTLGIWSGSSKLFEVFYMLIWYLGPINHIPQLDYTGMTNAALTLHMPMMYGISALFLGAAAVVGRRRQLQREGTS